MASKELNEDLQKKIQSLTLKARESFANKDFEKFVDIQHQKWGLIPEPKEEWEESYRICKMFITFYIKYGLDFSKAEKWLLELKRLDEIQDQHPGEVNLMQGKFFYEKGEFKRAYDLFHEAFKISEGHCFGNVDSEYRSFYTNPGNLLNN